MQLMTLEEMLAISLQLELGVHVCIDSPTCSVSYGNHLHYITIQTLTHD